MPAKLLRSVIAIAAWPSAAAVTTSGGGITLDPPFLGDALGSVGVPDPVLATPPGKAERRIVGQYPLRLDRLRRPEQPHRPRRFSGVRVLPSPGWLLPCGAG